MEKMEPNKETIKRMLADYKNASAINLLLKEYLAGDSDKEKGYTAEWKKTVKKRKTWLSEEVYSFEHTFDKKYPKENLLLSQKTNFGCFLSGSFSGNQIRKNTIGELDIYYSIETNTESPYIGFYLLVALYAYDGYQYAFVIAKSEKGCDDLFMTYTDFKKLTICNELLKAEFIDKSDFTDLFYFCEEGINLVNKNLGERLIKNY